MSSRDSRRPFYVRFFLSQQQAVKSVPEAGVRSRWTEDADRFFFFLHPINCLNRNHKCIRFFVVVVVVVTFTSSLGIHSKLAGCQELDNVADGLSFERARQFLMSF